MLTHRQSKFAAFLAEGFTASDSARLAGFANSNPAALRVTASRLQHHPDVKREAFIQREARLAGLAGKALKCLDSIISDEACPPAARVQAARYLLDAAGHGVVNRQLSARHPNNGTKAISDMTLAELETMVIHAESQLKQAEGREVDTDGNPQTAADSEEEEE